MTSRATSTPAAHPSDDELIELQYLELSHNPHCASCPSCQTRWSAMKATRSWLEEQGAETLEASADRLLAQRLAVYRRIEAAQAVGWARWRQTGAFARASSRWISAGAAASVLAIGLLLSHQENQPTVAEDKISDADLAREVSAVSTGAEASPAQPLKGLFE